MTEIEETEVCICPVSCTITFVKLVRPGEIDDTICKKKEGKGLVEGGLTSYRRRI